MTDYAIFTGERVMNMPKTPLELLDSDKGREIYDLKKLIDNDVRKYPEQNDLDARLSDLDVSANDFIAMDSERVTNIQSIVEDLKAYTELRYSLMDKMKDMDYTSIFELAEYSMFRYTDVIDEVLEYLGKDPIFRK